jgi:hypothetical protein
MTTLEPLESWERRHAVLVSRAETLDWVANDYELRLEAEDRETIRAVATKLRQAAHDLLARYR